MKVRFICFQTVDLSACRTAYKRHMHSLNMSFACVDSNTSTPADASRERVKANDYETPSKAIVPASDQPPQARARQAIMAGICGIRVTSSLRCAQYVTFSLEVLILSQLISYTLANTSHPCVIACAYYLCRIYLCSSLYAILSLSESTEFSVFPARRGSE
uniref:Uncharacterized protein n=1 Tax=Parascaris univalens TaxID=6257 RepID=A0A915BF00_PARUN